MSIQAPKLVFESCLQEEQSTARLEQRLFGLKPKDVRAISTFEPKQSESSTVEEVAANIQRIEEQSTARIEQRLSRFQDALSIPMNQNKVGQRQLKNVHI